LLCICSVFEQNSRTFQTGILLPRFLLCMLFNYNAILHILYSTLIEVAGQVMTPINSILRLYAAGLLLVSCNLRSRTGDLASPGSAEFGCLLGTLLENKKILQKSPSLLGSLRICSKRNCMSSSVEDQCLAGIPWTPSGFNSQASMTYKSVYVEALKFLCQPLAKSINSERKQLVSEVDDASDMTIMSTVQDAFHTFCHLILSSTRYSISSELFSSFTLIFL